MVRKSQVLVSFGFCVVACICIANLYSALNNSDGSALTPTGSLGDDTRRSLKSMFESIKEGYDILRFHLVKNNGSQNTVKFRDVTSKTLGLYNRTIYCDGSLEVGWNFVTLRNVTVDPTKGEGKPGGEDLFQVMGQRLDEEAYQLREGYFVVGCPIKTVRPYVSSIQLYELLKAVQFVQKSEINGDFNKKMIALVRNEYANFYHAMMDFYDVFLLTKIKGWNPKEVPILLLDSHPRGQLDPIWATLYGEIIRAGHLRKPLQAKDLVISAMGRKSLLNNHNSPTLPYMEEFRRHMMAQHGVQRTKSLNCSSLNFLFIWRRDYVAHARNPSGLVHRKILNEQELLSVAKQAFPGHRVDWVVFDDFSMAEQLRKTVDTDVLIGVHGAGLSHALFLPSHAGVIEFYPTFLGIGNAHFRSMAKWRRLPYIRWANRDRKTEKMTSYISLSPKLVVSMMEAMINEICQF